MSKSFSQEQIFESINKVKKWILLGIPIIILLSFPLHFVYEWSGSQTVIGIFAPINESVWEHLKLTFWPMLIWWLLGYFILRKNNKIPVEKWFVSFATAEVTCILFIVAFYYTYTGAFGIESLFLDILSLVLGVIVSQVLAFHIYKYSNPDKSISYAAVLILILLGASFIIFTFIPPQYPLFMDPITGQYGI